MNQVKSVESAAKILNSEFIGFHYTAAKKNSCGFDPLVGEFQFKNLVENETWLRQTKAKKIIEYSVYSVYNKN